MEVERTRCYPVSATTLVRVLTSREYFQTRHAWSGITEYRFDAFGECEEGFLIRISRPMEIPPEKVPAIASRLVPRSASLVTELCWTRLEQPPFRGRYRFALSGVPVEVAGWMTLQDERAGARQDIALRVNSRVPLIGARLSRLVAGGVDRALESDHRGMLRYIETLPPEEIITTAGEERD